MKKVVVVGGGSGIFNVLKGLKNYPLEITSIVTTFDNGGSTGILKDEFGTLPQGDIRRSLVALAPESGDSVLRDLLSYRFPKDSSLQGHSFGNLFLQALGAISGSEIKAIKTAAHILHIKHRILPVSLDDAVLCAELEDGSIVRGETNIDIPKHDGGKRIVRLYLEPEAAIYAEAYDALVAADLIILGPGDLYTSILPNVIVKGFAEAVKKSRGRVAYIANLMTKWGETNGYTASEFARILAQYLGCGKLDYVIGNNAPVKAGIAENYAAEKSFPVELDAQALEAYAKKIVAEDVMLQTDIVRHDPKKISRVIMNILDHA